MPSQQTTDTQEPEDPAFVISQEEVDSMGVEAADYCRRHPCGVPCKCGGEIAKPANFQRWLLADGVVLAQDTAGDVWDGAERNPSWYGNRPVMTEPEVGSMAWEAAQSAK